MGLKIEEFHGVVPKGKPEKLPQGYASYAENCQFHSGAIVPMLAPAPVGTVVDTCGNRFEGVPEAIHKLGDDLWIGFKKFTRPAEDPLNSFGRDTILYVDDGVLYRTSSSRVVRGECPVPVGICPPKKAPLSVVSGKCKGVDVDPSCYETALEGGSGDCEHNEMPPVANAFAYTWVTSCDEESGPSPFSEPLLSQENDEALITINETPPPNATKIRWYKLISSKDGASMLLVAETPVTQTAVAVCLNWYAGNDTLLSEGWFPMPSCAKGIVNIGQRAVMAWGGRHLYPSETGQPHAFPEIYRITLDDNIVAVLSYLTPTGSYVATVLTDGASYLIEETEPNRYKVTRHTKHMPALSEKSSFVDGDSVIYMTPYGIALIGGNGPSLLTEQWFDEKEWRQIQASEYVLGFFADRIYAISGVDNSPSFVFAVGNRTPYDPRDLVYLTVKATAIYQDDRTKLSYAGAFSGGTTVYEIEKSNQPMRAVWKSKFSIVPPLWTPNVASLWIDETRIPAKYRTWMEGAMRKYDSIPTEKQIVRFTREFPESKGLDFYAPEPMTKFTVYGQYEQRYSRLVWSTKPFRLPRKGRHREWHVEVETTSPVYSISISDSIDSLH